MVLSFYLSAILYIFTLTPNNSLFPPELFGQFIDVGHYKASLAEYTSLVKSFNNMNTRQQAAFNRGISEMNLDKPPCKVVRK